MNIFFHVGKAADHAFRPAYPHVHRPYYDVYESFKYTIVLIKGPGIIFSHPLAQDKKEVFLLEIPMQ